MLTIKIEKDGVTLLQVFVPETGGAAQVASPTGAVAGNRLGASFSGGRAAAQSGTNGGIPGGEGGNSSLED